MNLSTNVIDRLLNTPKNTLITLLNLTRRIRFMHSQRAGVPSRSARAVKLMPELCLSLGFLAITSITEATATSYSIDHLKLYAHSRILNWTEFQCFDKIITKESRWSYTAKNGSHYGLGQMRSKHYKDLDPFRQIDASLRYITNRYDTNCKAWAFHQKKGYY